MARQFITADKNGNKEQRAQDALFQLAEHLMSAGPARREPRRKRRGEREAEAEDQVHKEDGEGGGEGGPPRPQW